ncbi:MAG: hypothetical protein ISP32_06190 [Thermoleophilia bacterium]|nr:hypothetical protein [Thermoleophilia bacterium]
MLPDDLPADPCVVVLAFRRRQQRDVDAWVAELGPDAAVGEVPVLGRKWRRAAGWIEGGMATGTPQPARSRVWCAYADVSGVLAAMGQRGTRDVAVAVTTRTGAVRLVARGAPGPAAAGAVRAALRT